MFQLELKTIFIKVYLINIVFIIYYGGYLLAIKIARLGAG